MQAVAGLSVREGHSVGFLVVVDDAVPCQFGEVAVMEERLYPVTNVVGNVLGAAVGNVRGDVCREARERNRLVDLVEVGEHAPNVRVGEQFLERLRARLGLAPRPILVILVHTAVCRLLVYQPHTCTGKSATRSETRGLLLDDISSHGQFP